MKDKQREFLGNMFEHQFPEIIEIILIYSQRKESQFTTLVQEINKKMIQIVLEIMKDRSDFENIFKKLKNEFRGDKNPVQSQSHANTREIVVNWYIVLFKNFDNQLIDNNKDIFVTLIQNINFKFPKLV